jgi:hypothetical protein
LFPLGTQNNTGHLNEGANEDELAVCEVMYAAHPHSKAITALGEQRLSVINNLSFESMTAFSQRFMPMTRAIADDVADHQKTIKVLGQELVLGGYEGESIPSVALRVSVSDAQGYPALLNMAAHIGYVYAQDSVLVICSDQPPGNWEKASNVKVIDGGREKFLNDKNVPLLYGLMMGTFNSPKELGYTYYKDSKIFTTLAISGRPPGELQAMNSLSNWLFMLSNGNVNLDVNKENVWIFFPHNDWEKHPKGGAYLQYMFNAELNSELIRHQLNFIQEVDSFLNSSPVN